MSPCCMLEYLCCSSSSGHSAQIKRAARPRARHRGGARARPTLEPWRPRVAPQKPAERCQSSMLCTRACALDACSNTCAAARARLAAHRSSALLGPRARDRGGARARTESGVAYRPLLGAATKRGSNRSAFARTRKMVNYARAGRSRTKVRWKAAAILTCKSIVRPKRRGERPIEPSNSWFPPKFPSG